MITYTGKQANIVLGKDLISSTVEELADEILNNREFWSAHWEQLELDLRQVSAVDSLGLNWLLSLIKKNDLRTAEKILCRVSHPTVSSVFEMVRMDEFMTMQKD